MRLLGPLVPDVIEVVSEMTGYTVEQLTAARGNPRLCQARKVAYWVARQFGASSTEIARSLDRTSWTVDAGLSSIEANPSLKALAMEVADEVSSRFGGRPKVQPDAEVRR